MKKKYGIPMALGIASLLATSALLLSNKVVSEGQLPVLKVSSMTVSVPLPESVELCGQKVDLDRFDMRERFDREINGFAYFHSMTLLLIKRANRTFPIIEPILKRNDIPDDFKYLAVIESSLDYRAVSPARAVGLWQIMPDAGKENGLTINDQVDERYHVEKSTEAACRYFKSAYRKYGDWLAVAMSYNAGMGRISTELELQQAQSTLDLLLVEETSRYLYRMMAIKEVFSKPYAYGFVLKKENLYKSISTTNVEVSHSIDDLAVFARDNGITYSQLKEFNVWLRDRKLIVPAGRSYEIAIPDKNELYYSKGTITVHDKNWIELE